MVSDWRDLDEEAAALERILRAGPAAAREPVRRYRIVTFHPSFTYEEFIRGIRPVHREEESTTQFQVVDGVFKLACDEARANPSKRYAFFIDETNRANIAKVFGELITLIEPDKRAVYDSEGRSKAPVSSRSAAMRWGQDRERHLLQHGLPQPRKEVPTLEQFAPRFLDGHARANRQKPSGIVSKDSILQRHLVPLLGSKTLDAITTEHVQDVKRHLKDRAPKTVNNVLTVLNMLLKKAVEWDVIERMPCTIRLLPIPKPSAGFYDFDEYERLVEAAKAEPNAYLIVLLGGDAGLRCGEMMALEWRDVDLGKRQLCVQRSEWKGHVTVPKGGRLRYVPMTVRLAAALREHRHLRSARVLAQRDGAGLSADIVKHHVERAARRAPLTASGVHRLRHTFCSHLAMRGAPARAIQDLAGHQDLTTTQRYMHLSPAAIEGAIRLLDHPGPAVRRGDMLETAQGENGKSLI